MRSNLESSAQGGSGDRRVAGVGRADDDAEATARTADAGAEVRERGGLPSIARRSRLAWVGRFVIAAFGFGLGSAAVTLLAAPAAAAPPRVEPFASDTWAELQQHLPRPAIVVFTSTDCAHCPAVLERIDRERHARDPVAKLITVVMDVGPDEGAALSSPHYRIADRLMAFDDDPLKLRYAVDPRWIGVTPYVALLAPGAAPRFVMGAPEARDWSGLYAKSTGENGPRPPGGRPPRGLPEPTGGPGSVQAR